MFRSEGGSQRMEFNEKLKLLRETKGISQEKLAEEIGVQVQLIKKWESGDEVPDMHNLMALSDWFNVSIDELLRDRISLMTLNHLGFFEQEEDVIGHDLLENSLLLISMLGMLLALILNHILIGVGIGVVGVGLYYLIKWKKR